MNYDFKDIFCHLETISRDLKIVWIHAELNMMETTPWTTFDQKKSI